MSLEQHEISLQEGAKMTKAYREFPLANIGSLLQGTKGYLFSNDALQSVLDQTDCVSVRFYLAVEASVPPKLTIVAVGVDANGNDLTAGIILDKSITCPPYCGDDNVLNS